MKSLSETPDGSAVHPLAHISSGERPTQQAISADGISKINIADFSVPAKVKLPSAAIGTGIGAGLTLAPGEALGWGPGGLRTAELRPGEYGAGSFFQPATRSFHELELRCGILLAA